MELLLWFFFALCDPIRRCFQFNFKSGDWGFGMGNGIVVAHYRATIPLQWLLCVLDRCPIEGSTFQTDPFWIPISADYLSKHSNRHTDPLIIVSIKTK